MRDGVPRMRVSFLQVPPCCGEEAIEWSSSKGLERHGEDAFVIEGMIGGSLKLQAQARMSGG